MFNNFGTFVWFMNYYGACTVDEQRKVFVEDFFNLFNRRYEYKNVPETLMKQMNRKPLWEMMIFFTGACCWFEDPVLGLMCLPVSGGWKLNEIGKPTEWYVHGLGQSYTRYLNEGNSVIMFNDDACTIPFQHVMYNVNFMCDIDKVSKQNINTQFQPFVFYTEDATTRNADVKKSFIHAFKEFIYIRKKRGKDKMAKEDIGMEVFNTQVDFKVKEYMDASKEYENRILTYLGYKNVNIEKRERLLTGEISANDMIIQDNYTNCLNERKLAIEKVNEMFGTNISVEPQKLETLVGSLTSEYQGGVQDGQNTNVSSEGSVEGHNGAKQ